MAYMQSITITRRVADEEGALTKGAVLFDATDVAKNLDLADGWEVSAVDVWKIRIDKDGNEGRHYYDE